MKISIVTPSFNRATFLDDTIRSVLSQRGRFSIEYLVQDAGSGSEVLSILERWKGLVQRGDLDIGCDGISFDYVVEPDEGMYDAITRGFARTSGEVMAWINSDDMYHPGAFQTLSQIFGTFQNVFWATGVPNSYNVCGSRVGWDRAPDAYSRRYLSEGLYDVVFAEHGFNWIQQESTVWRRVLWDRSGGLPRGPRFAADFYLWRSFAQHADLVRIESFLGGFRIHDDQITSDPSRYRNELPSGRQAPVGMRQLRRLLTALPSARNKFLADAPEARERLRKEFGLERDDLAGRVIEWDFGRGEWVERWKLII